MVLFPTLDFFPYSVAKEFLIYGGHMAAWSEHYISSFFVTKYDHITKL